MLYMKNSKHILIAVAVVIVIIVGMMKVKTPVTEKSGDDVINLCYVWNTEAGDNASLKLQFSGEGATTVSGTFNFRPAEKDSKTGTFTGTSSELDTKTISRKISAIWQASAEGMTTPEELSIIVTPTMASAGFGEMKDRGDGTYVYANPDALTYEPNLQIVDCTDPALK